MSTSPVWRPVDVNNAVDESGPINLHDYRRLAKERLEKPVFDYYAGGSGDEITLRDNHEAYDRLQLRYRVLRDVSNRTLATRLLGHELTLPIIIAPTAFQSMAHPEGEVATSRAAGNIGTLMIVSTLSNRPIEDIVRASSGPVWFQLYVYKDREATRALIQRAEAAGCEALVLTVDAQVWGERERDARNRFKLPDGLEMNNLFAEKKDFPRATQGSALAAYVATMFDDGLSWRDLEWIRSISRLPLWIKGIVHPEDARLAVEHEADGVVVSNHGGRQVDTAPATIEVLPEIVDVVEGKVSVVVDGGIRRGSDVVKALALGADAVALGRPVLWGLAVNGSQGVEHVLSVLARETEAVMGLCGASRVTELNPEIVSLRPDSCGPRVRLGLGPVYRRPPPG